MTSGPSFPQGRDSLRTSGIYLKTKIDSPEQVGAGYQAGMTFKRLYHFLDFRQVPDRKSAVHHSLLLITILNCYNYLIRE